MRVPEAPQQTCFAGHCHCPSLAKPLGSGSSRHSNTSEPVLICIKPNGTQNQLYNPLKTRPIEPAPLAQPISRVCVVPKLKSEKDSQSQATTSSPPLNFYTNSKSINSPLESAQESAGLLRADFTLHRNSVEPALTNYLRPRLIKDHFNSKKAISSCSTSFTVARKEQLRSQ